MFFRLIWGVWFHERTNLVTFKYTGLWKNSFLNIIMFNFNIFKFYSDIIFILFKYCLWFTCSIDIVIYMLTTNAFDLIVLCSLQIQKYIAIFVPISWILTNNNVGSVISVKLKQLKQNKTYTDQQSYHLIGRFENIRHTINICSISFIMCITSI